MSTRADRLAQAVADEGLDALLITNLPNLRWATGFTGTNGAAVIGPDWGTHGTQSATATPAGLPPGIAGARQLHEEIRAIWPDNRWTIEDIFAARDRVAVRMTNRATHRGTYRGTGTFEVVCARSKC